MTQSTPQAPHPIRARQSGLARALSLDDFERWRPRMVAWLGFVACLLVAYSIGWLIDRRLVAGGSGTAYYQFEQAFPLADGWLLLTVVIAAVHLLRRRASALIALCAAGSASLYLFAMDVLYDIQHGIYSNGQGGVMELLINLLCFASGAMALGWGWRNRESLLGGRRRPATGVPCA